MLAAFRHFAVAKKFKLHYGRVYLRPPMMLDWRAWSGLRESSRDFLEPWEPTWPPDALSRDAFRRRIRQYAEDWYQGTGYSFLIFRVEDESLLGGISLGNVRRGVAQCGSLGYWIGAPFARKGYMAEGLSAITEFAFKRLGLHRLEAACLPENVASQRLLRKVGFRKQGYARDYLKIYGRWQDHVVFEILCTDPRGATAAPSYDEPDQA